MAEAMGTRNHVHMQTTSDQIIAMKISFQEWTSEMDK